jgi:hypothetical protein
LFVFEQRVVRGISELKRVEITGNRRNKHNEKLHYFHSLPDDEIKVDEMCKPCSNMKIKRNSNKM